MQLDTTAHQISMVHHLCLGIDIGASFDEALDKRHQHARLDIS